MPRIGPLQAGAGRGGERGLRLIVKLFNMRSNLYEQSTDRPIGIYLENQILKEVLVKQWKRYKIQCDRIDRLLLKGNKHERNRM